MRMSCINATERLPRDRISAVGRSIVPPTAQIVEAALLCANWSAFRSRVEVTDDLFREYVRFLALKVAHEDLFSDRLVVPRELEVVWKDHALYHAQDHYDALCKALAPEKFFQHQSGCGVHHEARDIPRRFETARLYRNAWGYVPIMWANVCSENSQTDTAHGLHTKAKLDRPLSEAEEWCTEDSPLHRQGLQRIQRMWMV